MIFTVIDEFGSIGNQATAFVTFNSTDDSPILDLNGPIQSGLDYSVQFIEGSAPIKVDCSLQIIIVHV